MWLNRSLLQGPKVAFVTTEKQFLKAKKAAGVECTDPLLTRSQHACVHYYEDGDGDLLCIVGLSLEACKRMSGIEVAALLAHEAVHVWQYVRDRLGPDADLGKEMEAYAIQNIAGNLMDAYARATS